MKYSIIKIENGNLLYCTNPDPLPEQIGNEGFRDFLFWQSKLTINTIRDVDKPSFQSYIDDPNLSGGIAIPYGIIEIYKHTDGRPYARMNESVVYDKNTNAVVGMNNKCRICHSIFGVDITNEKDLLNLCNECIEAFAELILTKRIAKKTYGN